MAHGVVVTVVVIVDTKHYISWNDLTTADKIMFKYQIAYENKHHIDNVLYTTKTRYNEWTTIYDF